MAFVRDGELAVAEGVPELDCSISGTRNYLSIVGGKGNREDVVVVTDEATSGGTGGEFPKAEGLIPRGG